MLQCQNVMKKYGKKTAVANITTNIVPGKIYALLGSNGSGKTTFMKMVAGLVKPTSGTITFNGMPIGEESKKYIAYMPTESFYYSYMTCKDAGKFYKDFYEDFDENKYYYLLNEMNLDPDMKVSKMSSGMTAKAKLALTLSRNSSIIIFRHI